MPFCNSSRYSAKNQIKKNKLKSNFNEIKDNNSLFFFEKDNNNKIFPNFNNNTCNISLNQHFYNIDYNNFSNASNSLLKKDDIENNTEEIKKLYKIKSIICSIYLCYYIRLTNDGKRGEFDYLRQTICQKH